MKKNRIRLSEAQLHNVIKESVRKVLKESLKEVSGNDIALINGSCGDDSYTLFDELEDLGMNRGHAYMLAGYAFPQEGNWLRAINLLKKAGVWNENYKQAYKEMVDGFFEKAKHSYDVGLRVLETYG